MVTSKTTVGWIGIAFSLVFTAGISEVRGDTFTASFPNQFGNAVWQVDQHIKNNADANDVASPGNWSTGAYPTNGHAISNPNNGDIIPGPNPSYNVVIGTGAGCTLSGDAAIQGLDLS